MDNDEDGVCDSLDIDDDDDGIVDGDDRSNTGTDWSKNPLMPEGGAGNAPNAVLTTRCVRTSIDEANIGLHEQGQDELALLPERRHWSHDLSGFYAQVDAFAHFLAASDLSTGSLAGTEMHNVRLDGVGENDRYTQWGVDVWNGEILNHWYDGSFTLRGNGDRFTMYARSSGVVNLVHGRLNPETGTIFDLRFLSLLQEPVDGACKWRLSFSARTSRVARSDLTYLCRDEDDRFGAAPELWQADNHCSLGRFAASADDLPHSTACTAGLDSDRDGQLDCDEDDDDDDDGVRDLDDRILGGDSFALDPTRPGDEPSSAPGAIMNDSCVSNAMQASGWDPSTAPRGYEPAFLGFLRQAIGAGYDTQTQNGAINPIVPASVGYELGVRWLGGDRTTQVGQMFDEQGLEAAFVHRDVIGRSGGQRYARFKRFPAYGQAQLIQGTIDDDGFTGDYLIVGVPPRPLKTCPGGSAGWYTRGVEHYLRVSADELEHVCVDEGRLRVAGQTWYRSDHALCSCSSLEQVSCTQ